MMQFGQVRTLVALATNAEHDFYRNVYNIKETLDSLTEAQWRTLPFLTKEDLLASPLRERVFIPLREVDHLRPSSGTSGKGALFSPRTPLRGMEYRLEYYDFKKPMLAYTVPAMPHWHEEFYARHGSPVAIVVYDPANPAASIRVARDAGVESISLFAFHMLQVGEHMQREGMCEHIRFIELAGEACSRKLFEYMRATFPNATILPFYGSSEVEDSPIGMPCRPITGEEPLSVYHGKESHYLELRDPETNRIVDPKRSAEGELVITAYPGEPSAFPLLRFRTGDTVRVVEEQCEKHGSWSFTLLGRTEMDFLKVPGGILRADEVERVLRLFPDLVTDTFTLHVYEEPAGNGPRFRLRLEVEMLRELDHTELARTIEREVRISPRMTWAEGILEGRFLPLTVDRLMQNGGGKKHRRMVRHD